MRVLNYLLALALVFQTISLQAIARPGESLDTVLKRFNLEGQQPSTLGDYILYKPAGTKFVSQPTLFFKTGAHNVVLEQNFLFDKNTVHEKDVQRAKNDSLPSINIPHAFYLVGDYSQLPREQFDVKSKVIGAVAAPLGAAAGTIAGAGKGVVEGTKIGVKTASSASKAEGGDVSGKAAAWASSATAVATGAITGLFGGFTGGAVEGSVRGARVALEGFSGADRQITGVTPAISNYVVIGGRIGKGLTPDEQKSLLDALSKLEQTRLAGGSLDFDSDKNLAGGEPPTPSDSDNLANDKSNTFDSAKDKSGFEESTSYLQEDSENKNVAGMW